MKQEKQAQLNKKSRPRAIFQGDFRKHAFVKTYICPGNNNQEHENFEAFLDLVLRESDTIKGIEIIDTTELYEKHYNQTLPNFKSKYEGMIEKKLGKGEQALVQWKITSWSDRTNTTAYNEAYQRAAQDYKQNIYNLAAVVSSTVKPYKKLKDEEAANNYGLEELAEFATQKGAVVFPGKLNGILKWGLKHYKIPVSFIRYKFKEITNNSSESLSGDDSDDMDVPMPIHQSVKSQTVTTSSGVRFFPVINERRKSPPLVYSSSPEDDETAVLLETVGFYAVKAKERIQKQHNVDGYQAQLIFLQGYLDYCQRAGNNHQVISKQPTLVMESLYSDGGTIEHKM